MFLCSCNADEIQQNQQLQLIGDKVEPEDTLVTIIGVGDIMLGTNFPSEKHLPPKNLKLLSNMYEILKSADFTFGNLEGAVADSGGIVKECSDPKICYEFRQPEYLIKELVESEFDLISIANNHILDFGNEIAENTVKVLEKNGFTFAGIDSRPWDTLTIRGIKTGFCAFAPNPGTLSILDFEQAKNIISHLDSISDIVVVSIHGGAEGTKHCNITRDYELFYDENRGNVYEFAHNAIDNGADIVFGHGPHVTRAVEIYKNRFIAYSLGNFCTYDRFNISGKSGIAPLIKIAVAKNGEFRSGEVISIKQKGRGVPVVDSSNAALKELIKLTNIDFPDNNIQFKENMFTIRK